MGKPDDWSEFLAEFHTSHAGAISEVLERLRAGDHNPHNWMARAVSAQASTIIDVASGSGSMARELAREGRTVVSVDLSVAELAIAAGSGPVVRADGLRLPFADESADVVTSSMGLAVITPATQVLAEMARVLRPGGVLVAMGPTVRPFKPSDVLEVGALIGAMRGRPRVPGVLERIGLAEALPAAGLHKVEDARQRYGFTVANRADAELVMSALYLTSDAAAGQVAAGVEHLVARVEQRGTVVLPVPMRRLVAIK
ncbi:class I SAM-dependent methyltransferase [Propionibacteriaceae bacterium Y2011]|uniref:class I SAM-dependent methyltransferase n=1 Tax=Microlunatus sp. Y2014 TaxID=3418488 RepID=UPI003B4C4581